jgi:hypothetical protein
MDRDQDDRAWFSGLAGALAQQRLLRTIVLPTAISGVLVDLGDRPPLLVLAATRVFRETSLTALEQLALLAPPLDCTAAAAALRRAADSCGRLLDAAERG